MLGEKSNPGMASVSIKLDYIHDREAQQGHSPVLIKACIIQAC